MADLIAALCLRKGGMRVLDPSCGDGSLLVRARGRLDMRGGGEVVGVELDPTLSARARGRLSAASIVQADFLSLAARPARKRPVALREPFDAIVGNPPYVRQELISTDRKKDLAAMARAGGWPVMPGRCDLHAWFWAPALSMLRPGGRLCWVVSATWMDAAYGHPLREWLAQCATVVAVIESDVECWFDEARVRTAIVVVEKTEPGGREAVRFVRLDRRLDDFAPLSLPEPLRLARIESLARFLDGSGAGASSVDGGTVVEAPAASLSDGPWGGRIASAGLCGEIVARARKKLAPLGEIATVRWGIKSGDDKLFFRTDGGDGRFLRPAVFSQMDLDRPVVDPRRLPRRLLMIDRRRRSHREELARRGSWLAGVLRGARRRGSHMRPTCASRESRRGSGRRWFELRPGSPGAILWSVMHQYRHLAALNPRGVPANDNLLLIDPMPGVGARELAAVLNSHVQALLKRAAGRRRNEGMLKTQASDVRRMLVPDPRRIDPEALEAIARAFDHLAGRPVGPISRECGRADRRRHDELVLRALGFTAPEAGEVTARLERELVDLHARERMGELDAARLKRGAR